MDEEPAAPDLGAELIAAAKQGNVAQVGVLLDQGVDIEASGTGTGDWNALHWAIYSGKREVVTLLLDRGANIEVVCADGSTPIFRAVFNHLKMMQLLHDRGANIHQANKAGQTVLHLVSRYDYLPVCEFLVSNGADPEEVSNVGETALSIYGNNQLSPEIKALRCDAIRVAQIAHWRMTALAHRSTNEVLRTTIEAQRDENNRLTAIAQIPASLLFSDAFSDLVFVCPSGERIHAHRSIVAAASTQMGVLLQSPTWAENVDERVAVVQMPQSAAAVRALLRFLYTGEADAAAIEASMSDVLDLASQHEQPALKAACERHAIAALSVPTVVPILVMAHLHELNALKAVCVGLFKANTVIIMTSKAFMRLHATHPLLLRELRVALDLPEVEKEEEEEEEGGREETQDRKRARHSD